MLVTSHNLFLHCNTKLKKNKDLCYNLLYKIFLKRIIIERIGRIILDRYTEDGNFIIEKQKDFILSQTLECGQCFHFVKLDEEDYLISAKSRILHIAQKENRTIFYNTDEQDQPIKIFRLYNDKGNSRSYICLDLWRENSNDDMGEECITRIYAFEEGKISTSIKKVRDISTQIKVSPVMPRRNEIVSVDISSVQSPTSLTVVSAAGQVVCSQNLHDGQKNASIDTSRLTSGLYIVRVANSNKEYENCRIIIR